MVTICLEIKTECKHCGGALVLNAFTNEILCPACQQINEFPYGLWKKSIVDSALHEYSDLHEGEGQNQTVMTGEYTFHTMYGLQKPRCGKCKTTLPEQMYPQFAIAGKAVCSKCANEIYVRTLPDNLKSDFGNIKYIIGEDPDMLSAGNSTSKAPDAVKPILFSCPSCGGNLKIDGSKRVVTCTFCNSDIYLPDDLWLRMHPVKVVERWYMIIDEKEMPEKLAEWGDISDAVADKNGNVYLATADGSDKFLLVSMGLDYKTRWIVPGLDYSKDDTGLALTYDGRIYLWDKKKDSLLILSAKDGSTITKLSGREATADEPEPFNMKGTNSLAIDKDGTLIVLKDNKILRFSVEGKVLETWGEQAKVKKKGFFGKLFGSSDSEDSSPDVDELKNSPRKVDSGYTFVFCGEDGFTYLMESTSSEDKSFSKYDRNGEQIWSISVPLEEKYPKPFADKNGNVYVLGKQTGDKYTLIRLNGSAMNWEVLVKDIRDGGQLNEVERLAAAPDGSRFYCLEYDSRLRVFDSEFKMIYISSESKEDDEDP